MNKWLGPTDVQTLLKIKRSTAYKYINLYIQSGGEHWRTGRITRVPEKQFTEFLLRKSNEESN